MNAPSRRLLVMDSSKLSYFARAQAVRAGAQGTYGALAGFGTFGTAWEDSQAEEAEREFAERQMRETGALFTGGAAGGGAKVATAENTKAGGGMQLVDSLVGGLNRLLSPTPTPAAIQAGFRPSPWPLVLGAAALVVGGIVLVKVMKR